MVEGQEKCLRALAELTLPGGEWCSAFRSIIEATGMDRRTVRINVRALARKGLAEYHKALWTDDGTPAGAGYCITQEGQAVAAKLVESDPAGSGGAAGAGERTVR
jgi:hypothetical protein